MKLTYAFTLECLTLTPNFDFFLSILETTLSIEIKFEVIRFVNLGIMHIWSNQFLMLNVHFKIQAFLADDSFLGVDEKLLNLKGWEYQELVCDKIFVG